MKRGFLVIALLCMALLLTGCACKHPETELKGAVDATCTQEGYTGDTVCLKCEATVEKGEVIPMLDHTPGEKVNVQMTTCEQDGYTGDTLCTVCGAELEKGEVIPATGHQPGQRYHVVESTCTRDGYTGQVDCMVCYKTLEEDERIPTLGHTWGEPHDVVEATCQQAGYMGDQDCTVCGETQRGEVVPKLAHDFVDGVCTACSWLEPGLYAEGEMLMSWADLLGNEYIRLDGAKDYRLGYIADSLFGTLVVDDSITEVGNGKPLCSSTDSKLEAIYLPTSVKKIYKEAFCRCSNLKEVCFFGPVQSIGNDAFRNCAALESFDIPEGLTVITQYMLAGCTSLKQITIPEWVERVNLCAFAGCTSLKSVEISEGVQVIEAYCFQDTAVRELTFPSTMTKIADMTSRGSMDHLTKLDFSRTSLTEIGSFPYCPALKTIVFPDTLEKLGSFTLGECYALEELILPEGLKSVPGQFFFINKDDHSMLRRIVWPVSLLDGSAFAKCTDLEEIAYRGSELQWELTLSKDQFEGVNVIFNYED